MSAACSLRDLAITFANIAASAESPAYCLLMVTNTASIDMIISEAAGS